MLKKLKLLLSFLLFYQSLSNYISIDISSTNNIINQPSIYTFRFTRDINPLTSDFITPTNIALNSIVSIVFPIQYATIANGTNLACTNADTGVALTCGVTEGNKTLLVLDFYTNNSALADLYPGITVSSIINPYKSGQSSNFLYSITSPDGTVVDKSPSATNGIYFPSFTSSPGLFSSCSISASGSTILTRSKLTISLTPKNPIPSSGIILLSFPLFWSNDVVLSRTLTTSPTCLPLSNVSGSLSCTYSIATAPVNLVYLTISGLTNSALTSTFSFTVQSILTPPYINPSDNVVITSQWGDGAQIDTCKTIVTDLTPIKFQAISFATIDNNTVQSGFNGLLSVTLAQSFAYTDTITFGLPLEFMGATIASTAFGFFLQNKDVSNQAIMLYNFPTTSSKSASTVLNFTLAGLINPNSIQQVSLTISFYRSGSLYQQQSIQYAAFAGTPTSFTLLPDSPFVNSNDFATAQISTSLSIPTSSILLISYPSTITSSSITSTAVKSALLNGISVSQVKFSVQANTIRIQNFFQSTFVGGVVSVTFPSFKNPPTVQNSTYLLTVQTSDAFTIFSGLTYIVASLKGLMSNQITASSYKVLANSILTVSVELNYQATTISVIVPTDIFIKTGFEATCLPNNLTGCSLNGNNLTFQGNFQPGVQSLSWGNTQNPNSFQPTSPFTISTYYRGWGVEKSLGYINLQMNETNTFSSVLISPSNLTNNQIISVNMKISFPINGISSGTLIVIFPDVLDISSMTCNISCLKISNNVTLSLTSQLSLLAITFSNIINSASYLPIPQFMITLQNTLSYSSLSQSYSGWTNIYPSTFTSLVSTPSAYLSSLALFKFQLSLLTGKQTYVTIRFNDLFGELMVNPTGGQLINGRLVRFYIENLVSKEIYLQLVTPPVFGDYTFTLETYQTAPNGTNYLVGQSTTNVWRHSCFGTVCKECDIVNNSQCISCYDQSASDYYILDTTLKTCIRACTAGFYLTTLNACSPCNSNCMQCIKSSTNCTSCNPLQSLFLDLTYKKCILTCSPGQYANTQIQQCLSCSPVCLTCSQTLSHCLTCPISTFLLNFDCLSSCPTTNQYISTVSTRTCDLCVTNCVTCFGYVTNCTSCNGSLALYLENGKCVGICKANSFISVTQGKCVSCQAPCNMCTTNYDVCATCLANNTTPIWYANGCITANNCPSGNFVNIVNSSCDKCQTQCSVCSSLTSCSSCKTGFSLYQNQCITPCPNTTYQTNQVCITCNGCYTCSNSLTNCTSCVISQSLYLGVCYPVCPATTFKNTTLRSCIACPSDCPSCLNSTYCSSCLSTLYILNGACILTCPSRTFPTIILPLTCTSCPSQCLTCTSLTSCLTCSPSFNLQNDTKCVATCSKGIAYNQFCYPCGLNCANCNQMAEMCLICDNTYLLSKGKCAKNCPGNELSLDGKTCVACSVKFGGNCTTCEFSGCLSCANGQLTGGECWPCPEGTYSNDNKCATCPSVCKACTNSITCQSCISSYYIESSYCTSTCPLNKVPNGTLCTACLQSCAVCNRTNSLCSICSSGSYLYQSRCVSICPSPLIISLDSTKCVTQQVFYQEYSKQAKIVYFPFGIAALVIVLIGIGIKCYSKETHLATFLCGLLSFLETGSWAEFLYIEYLSWSNYHEDALKGLVLTIAALGILMVLAMIHIKFYCKYITSDSQFTKWQSKNGCSNITLLSLSSILNFKIYRLVYSRLLSRHEFSLVLMSLNKLLPFSLLSLTSLILCSIPITIGCSLALYFSITQDQQFYAAMDCLSVTGLMAVMVLLDMKHQGTYFFVEVESSNIRRYVYEEQDFRISAEGSQIEHDQHNISKEKLLEEAQGELPGQSATKLRMQSVNKVSDLQRTQALSHTKSKQAYKQQSSDVDFQIISQNGDQAIYMPQNQSLSSIQSPKQRQKWVQKQYDRYGYLLKPNQQGQLQKYDQNGYIVQIDQNGKHHKFDSNGNQMVQRDGQFFVMDKHNSNHYWKDDKRYDQRGLQVRNNIQGEEQFFNTDGFRVVQNQHGQIQLFDQHAHQIITDADGNIQRLTPQGHFAHVSSSGKITYTDKHGNHLRKNELKEYQIYDPQDGFILKPDQNGNLIKYDKSGYRIQKDKYGNIKRYDEDNLRVVLGPGDTIQKFDSDGYKVIKDDQGKTKRYDKRGYEVKIDQKGGKHFHDLNGYQVIEDYDGEITLIDKDGYTVVIDPITKQHWKFTSEGLRVVIKDNQIYFYDKRGKRVLQIEDGLYQKYDQNGNKMWLDQDGFQVEIDQNGQNGQNVRYDKVGDKVDQQKFQQEQKQQQLDQQMNGIQKKVRKFKRPQQLNFQEQYLKMIHPQQLQQIGSQVQQYPHLKQFHDISQPIQPLDLQSQLATLRNRQFLQEPFDQQSQLNLQNLPQIDCTPQKQLIQNNTNGKVIKKKGSYIQGNGLDAEEIQDDVELKSVADAEIDQRSFQNQGVQPIDIDDSQYGSQLESIDQMSPNRRVKVSKRTRGQHSQLSFIQGEGHDTKTQYNHKNHKKVNIAIKNNNIYDQNQQIESLQQDNWLQPPIASFYPKELSSANTAIPNFQKHSTDTLSQFINQHSSKISHNNPHSNRYNLSKGNTIQEMQNQLFEQGIKERTQFKMVGGPNPLVQYAKGLTKERKHEDRVYQEVKRKKRR